MGGGRGCSAGAGGLRDPAAAERCWHRFAHYQYGLPILLPSCRLARRHADCVGRQGGQPAQAVRAPHCFGCGCRLAQQYHVCQLLAGWQHRGLQAVRQQAPAALAGGSGRRCAWAEWVAHLLTACQLTACLLTARVCQPDDAPATPCPARIAFPSSPQGAHAADINSLRWEPSGKLLASCSDDGSVKIWQATAEKPVHTLAGVLSLAAASVLLAVCLSRRLCCLLHRLGDLAGSALMPAGDSPPPSLTRSLDPAPAVLPACRACGPGDGGAVGAEQRRQEPAGLLWGRRQRAGVGRGGGGLRARL